MRPEAVARSKRGDGEGEAAAAEELGRQARAVKGVEEEAVAAAAEANGGGEAETAAPPPPPPRSLPARDRSTSHALPSAVSSVRRRGEGGEEKAETKGWNEAATKEVIVVVAASVPAVVAFSRSDTSTVAEGSITPFSSSTRE